MVLGARGCHWLGRLQDTPRLSGSVALGRTGKASNQMKVDPIWEEIIFDRFLDERYAVLYIYICFCFLFVHVDLAVLWFLFLCTGRCLCGCFLGWTCICRTDSCKAGPVGAGFHFQPNLDVPGT